MTPLQNLLTRSTNLPCNFSALFQYVELSVSLSIVANFIPRLDPVIASLSHVISTQHHTMQYDERFALENGQASCQIQLALKMFKLKM